MKKIILLMLAFSLIVIVPVSAQESITIETVYPSPVGYYQTLTMNPADFDTGLPCQPGEVRFHLSNNRRYACVDDSGTGKWTSSGGTLVFETTDSCGNGHPVIYKDDPADTFFGLGIKCPEMKLHIEGDGGILATGTQGAGTALSTTGAGTRMIWYPRRAAFRAGNVNSDQWDDFNIGDYSVAFGRNNLAAGPVSTIAGGDGNTIELNTGFSFIGNGINNDILGGLDHNFIGSGIDNDIGETPGGGAHISAIVAGNSNKIKANNMNAFIGGGVGNEIQANGQSNIIVGGNNNRIWDTTKYATISGGGDDLPLGGHVIWGDYSTVSGGRRNTIGTTMGPLANRGATNYASIAGGQNNIIGSGASHFFIGGGFNNIGQNQANSALGGVIVGGSNNSYALGDYSVIGGGFAQEMNGSYSVVAGGSSNKVRGRGCVDYSTVSGGFTNFVMFLDGSTCSDIANTISGGRNNLIDGDGPTPGMAHADSTIGGGNSNHISMPGSVIAGGINNTIGTPNSVIGGGQNNNITAGASALVDDGSISTAFSVIGGGRSNVVAISDAVIAGGAFNYTDGDYSAVNGGRNNRILILGTGSVIGGGQGNRITAPLSYVFGRNVTANTFRTYMIGTDQPNETFDLGVNVMSGGAPQAPLDVNGNAIIRGNLQLLAYAGAAPGIGGPGNLSVAGTVTVGTKGPPSAAPANWSGTGPWVLSDIAEQYTTSEVVEVGDVLSIDNNADMLLRKSIAPYETTAVGIVSSSPAILFEDSEIKIAPQPGEFESGTEIPLALVGRVLCKVSTENGPIERGDLLTTSSTPGHAMKVTDHLKAIGAIVGKALESFKEGEDGETTGMIVVLVTLQ